MTGVVHSSSRALFADLVRRATDEQAARLSPMAVTYLVELLEARVRAPGPESGERWECDTLAEALLAARLEQGTTRARRLRAVGDRTLFVAGFFGDSLRRRGPGEGYYCQIGCAAYDSLSRCLGRGYEQAWSALFHELSQHFQSLVELLGDVGDRTRPDGVDVVLRLYELYLASGSERDRRRLLRRGVPVQPQDAKVLQ